MSRSIEWCGREPAGPDSRRIRRLGTASVPRPDRSGLLLRSAEGLVLRLVGGRESVVAVDDAATGAARFNAYPDRVCAATSASKRRG
ncbi:hypothetical protein [Streptomyces halobius]|uniref:Uncharacterized protein n=1 Tax=Streptomyces halobius TaxID=2879846 RepID=A0ABY4MLX3_9ACTN|nr:hypothetical protein [Streptomyces halobius]UQA98192.1 hypothetical protein K9S39_12765 [Streptomyces halobius]